MPQFLDRHQFTPAISVGHGSLEVGPVAEFGWNGGNGIDANWQYVGTKQCIQERRLPGTHPPEHCDLEAIVFHASSERIDPWPELNQSVAGGNLLQQAKQSYVVTCLLKLLEALLEIRA